MEKESTNKYPVFLALVLISLAIFAILGSNYDHQKVVVQSSKLTEIAPAHFVYVNHYYAPEDSATYYSTQNPKQTPGDTLKVEQNTLIKYE